MQSSAQSTDAPATHRLSPHFTLAELTVSETAARRGLSNQPPDSLLPNLRRTAERMEAVREILGGKPIIVTSGYRSREVNALVGGAPTSHHLQGFAVDFLCPGFGSPYDVCQALATAKTLEFDQLIHEFRAWTHLSFAPALRRQKLSVYGSPATSRPGIWR